ncbi:MAG: acyl--CoA ligase [Reyranella sp.]|uniref:class I adenylate-forming enzyme family protein n=1 Tax=Reyranella sp. TaxID=1929291 RepID=UPI001AD05F84|nr:class I adenylate-forming enzyme family protein [Reyranella sp.]MBN9085679.1 acyl--CoA ligase [Reyranella sp.]
MTITNLAAILDPDAPDDRDFIIQLSPEAEEELRLSWGEARARVGGLARGLLRRGLKHGDAVAIVAANSADYLVLYMATMAAGLVSVCVNHKLPRETVAHIMTDSGVKLAVADDERAPLVRELVPTLALADLESLIDPGAFTPVEMKSEETAMVLYTSGSTGLPKGVPLSHGGYVWATTCTPEQRPAIEGKAVIIAAPLFHMNGLFSAKLVMAYGGTIVLMTGFTAKGYIRAIERHRVSMVTSVPTMLALVMREAEALVTADLSSVTTAVTGSAPSTAEFFEQMHRLFPNAETANSWGTTESGPIAFGPHPDGVPKPPSALGHPRKGIEVRLVDGDAHQGVLHIRTPALMSGYYNREADTRKRLIDGWYDTGDVMRRDANGFYSFVGRADDMFQCGGENVYPGEVEKLLGRHPDVAQVCVVPVADAIKYQLPVAFVVPKPGTTPSEDALRRFALDNGPAYAHPRAVWFVAELPLAGTNKIDRKALVERAAASYKRETRQV